MTPLTVKAKHGLSEPRLMDRGVALRSTDGSLDEKPKKSDRRVASCLAFSVGEESCLVSNSRQGDEAPTSRHDSRRRHRIGGGRCTMLLSRLGRRPLRSSSSPSSAPLEPLVKRHLTVMENVL